MLPELIQASWQRCRHYGMSPQWQITQAPLSDSELHLQQEQNRQLRKLALREMNLLEPGLSTAGRILLLADAQGVVLDSQGDSTFLGRARKVSLMPGASWREQITGTNAIGTAIVERRFVQVIGEQHFFDENRFLACNAMPIFSPTGQLAGVLDISGSAFVNAPSASKLVRHAVQHIEHDWTAESATDLVVRLHQHPSWLSTPEEGLLCFNDGVLSAASSRGLAFLGLGAAVIGRVHWRDIFQGAPTYGRQELRLQQAAGLYYADVSRSSVLSASIAASEVPHAGPESFEDLKDEALRRAVAAENGNVSAAARKLGIHRSTFYRRLKQEPN